MKKTGFIRWGILGVGDVCEVKSGPAFQKAANSELIAVMRRDADKAEDFARRHGVPRWYDSADQLLGADDIDAIYVASPPNRHLEHTLAAIAAGKHVYLEKPMAMSVNECQQIIAAEKKSSVKVAVAHYRRALPAFIKVGEIIKNGGIGSPRIAEVRIFQSSKDSRIATAKDNWRWDPDVSGGGLFHDLAPHLLDLMLHYFGQPLKTSGVSLRQNKTTRAADLVQGTIIFPRDVLFQGCWSFSIAACAAQDLLTITGDSGQVSCDFFGENIILKNADGEKKYQFSNPENIQQPMIEQVVRYFLNTGSCPCSPKDGLTTIQMISEITGTEQ